MFRPITMFTVIQQTHLNTGNRHKTLNRLRRWTKVKPTLIQRLVSAGMSWNLCWFDVGSALPTLHQHQKHQHRPNMIVFSHQVFFARADWFVVRGARGKLSWVTIQSLPCGRGQTSEQLILVRNYLFIILWGKRGFSHRMSALGWDQSVGRWDREGAPRVTCQLISNEPNFSRVAKTRGRSSPLLCVCLCVCY